MNTTPEKSELKILRDIDFKKIIESGHINLLIGSGCSTPFLEVLGSIENNINSKNGDKSKKAKKEYCEEISKSLGLLKSQDGESPKAMSETKGNYSDFLRLWQKIITDRSLNIVNKQINIFTTNFDMFIEYSCEELGIQYNDGFSGQIKSTFSTSNFNKVLKYKSLQFDNISDIPLFNIIKLHGSTSWKKRGGEIFYSRSNKYLSEEDLKSEESINKWFSKMSVVLPSNDKHIDTVMQTTYSSLLRKFTLELEKENSVLIILGFSLADEHIRDLLYGAMKTNPTLIVFYFSHEVYDSAKDTLKEKKNPNLYVISGTKCKLSFQESTKKIRQMIFNED